MLSIFWNFNQVSSLCLLLLDRDKQALEVASSKSFVVSSLYDLEEQCWPVLYWFREDLKEIALIVIVDKDFVFLEDIDVFTNFDVHVREVLSQVVVVSVRNGQKLNSSLFHAFHRRDDIIRL